MNRIFFIALNIQRRYRYTTWVLLVLSGMMLHENHMILLSQTKQTRPTQISPRANRTLPNDNMPPEFVEGTSTQTAPAKKNVIAGEPSSSAQKFVKRDSSTITFRAGIADEEEQSTAPKPKPSPFAGFKTKVYTIKLPAQARTQPRTQKIKAYLINERSYISVAMLRSMLNGKGTRVGEIILGQDILRLAPYSFYVVAERREGIAMVQLPYPCIVVANHLLVPFDPMMSALQTLGLFIVEQASEQSVTTLWRTDQTPLKTTAFAYPDSITPTRFDDTVPTDKTNDSRSSLPETSARTMPENSSSGEKQYPLPTLRDSVEPRTTIPSLKPVLAGTKNSTKDVAIKGVTTPTTLSKSLPATKNMAPPSLVPVLGNKQLDTVGVQPSFIQPQSVLPDDTSKVSQKQEQKQLPEHTNSTNLTRHSNNKADRKADASAHIPLRKPLITNESDNMAKGSNSSNASLPNTSVPKLIRRELSEPTIVPQKPMATPSETFPQPTGRTYKLPKNLKRKELEKDSLQSFVRPLIHKKKRFYLASLDIAMPMQATPIYEPLPNNLSSGHTYSRRSDDDIAPQTPSKKSISKQKKSSSDKKTSGDKQSSSEKKKWSLDVIVIDPGHGGKDEGARGVHGTLEKDVVLSIGKKLGALLKEELPETKVVFTRSDDRFIELYRRGQIANEAKGKLFISLHCNSMPKKPHPAKGFETYILKPERSDDAIHVAEAENAVIKLESDQKRYKKLTQEEFIIVNMMQSAFMKFSEKFAGFVQKNVTSSLPLQSRGVNQAGFLVLVGASMPSVLIETGFLSNTTEEKYLRSTKGQQAIAETIFRAIEQYRREYERLIKTDTSSE